MRATVVYRFDSCSSHMSKHLTKEDVDRYGLTGDPGFSPNRNEAVIKHTIKRAEELRKLKKQRIQEGLEERSDMVYGYIRKMLDSGKDMKIEDYAGWHNMKKLWGETRVKEMQDRAIKLGY